MALDDCNQPLMLFLMLIFCCQLRRDDDWRSDVRGDRLRQRQDRECPFLALSSPAFQRCANHRDGYGRSQRAKSRPYVCCRFFDLLGEFRVTYSGVFDLLAYRREEFPERGRLSLTLQYFLRVFFECDTLAAALSDILALTSAEMLSVSVIRYSVATDLE